MLTDLLLARNIRNGDIKAYEQVFRHYYTPLLYCATGITGRSDVAEEIIQDLFYSIWRDRELLDVKSSLKGYLFTSVKNSSLQFCRREKLGERYSVYAMDDSKSDPDPLNDLEYKEMESFIYGALARMPLRRAQIFKMHRFDGKKYSEIADAFSLSVKSIEAEMTKAIRQLREEIEKQ
ncbi:MAG: RNA polymerase sigma-70 factor [Thiovulaceae bacterium]|nr:RNA polymerase sigma-70 factor [Sulfurimonadaceae bacterium]